MNKNYNKSWMDSAINESIKPVSVSIYYENGVPYLNYVGETRLTNGYHVHVEIPKMSLELNKVDSVWEDKSEYIGKRLYLKGYMQEMFAGNDNKTRMNIIPLERDMTKEDLEKELGYKINLIE